MALKKQNKREQFYRQLKIVMNPTLRDYGFDYDKKRSFRRKVKDKELKIVQLIEFQLGIKGRFIGFFTANLGVYSHQYRPADWKEPEAEPTSNDCLPALCQRLGFLIQPKPTIMQRLFRHEQLPKDHWWPQCENSQAMAEVLRDIAAEITDTVIPWLDLRSSSEAFEWATSELARAKRWKEQLGSPGADPHFHMRYYEGAR